uniref:Uncharacterized protein n=1 Tax=Oryza glumipatula TaxID=40148 RepID=A0A0E0BSL6_9ORYZ
MGHHGEGPRGGASTVAAAGAHGRPLLVSVPVAMTELSRSTIGCWVGAMTTLGTGGLGIGTVAAASD